MTDQQAIATVGETVWGAGWPAAMAAALSRPETEIDAWRTGRRPVPAAAWKDLRELAREKALRLADLDAQIVAAFDAAWQREAARPR